MPSRCVRGGAFCVARIFGRLTNSVPVRDPRYESGLFLSPFRESANELSETWFLALRHTTLFPQKTGELEHPEI
jgi:hypothetical protein